MSERHELFEELEAFDPKFQENYRTLHLAVAAASLDTPYVKELYTDYARTFDRSGIDDVFDTQGAIESAQRAEAESPAFQEAYASFELMRGPGRGHE
jgi:hypothetical protein